MTYLVVCAVVAGSVIAMWRDRTATAHMHTTTAPISHVQTITTALFDWAESDAA